MLKLNRDVIFLILEELQNDSKSLYSCLLINRTWCETTVPILWKDPTSRYDLTDDACNILFNKILLHLSEESRNKLKNQEIDLLIEIYKRPLFNYISFWKHLDLCFLEYMMNVFKIKNSKISNEVLKLFTNNGKKFISLSIPESFNYHLFSWNEHCFLELEYFYFDCNINSDILKELSTIITSIKNLELNIKYKNTTDPSRIVKLIEAQKNLKEVSLIHDYYIKINESYHKILEESLIKCANTVQYLKIDWKPITNFLSYLVNLVSLKLSYFYTNWNYSVSLPLLKYLKANGVSSEVLASIIENTKGNLNEIIINYQHHHNDKRLIKAIYQHCPNLNYLKLSLLNKDMDIIEFQNLLINCKFINILDIIGIGDFIWNELLIILTKYSPINLLKLKLFCYLPNSNFIRSLKLFLDSRKNKSPIFLQIDSMRLWERQQQPMLQQLEHLLKEYKVKGIIKDFECP
ncbi:hypothetical protein RhiirA4_545210 [Rhizophagus irregularis]|uniref:F-box domain-containing protein n=1 Tax=Rhizophagus irregularis TaxID=588596 RepID=A0A2I1GRS8_9GLOM|nr:hypothetical protein RhiirA4_545210 [Rhizophagus irregularis]